MTEHVAHFTVTGEFLTRHARQLWADENRPDRAVDLLLNGLMGIDVGQVIDVLTGQSKLEGDSNQGIEIVEDDATLSPCGQPLPSLAGMFVQTRQRAERAEEDAFDLTEILAGSGAMIPSPKGLVEVSRRTALDLKTRKIQWEDVRIYRELMDPYARPPEDDEAPQVARLLEDEPEPPPPPPLKPHSTIVTDSGWLSPDGKFYPCGWQEHISMADCIQRERAPDEDEPMVGGWEHTLEKGGWVKLCGRNGAFEGEREPTERQKTKILEWCMGEGKDLTPLPYWLKPEK